MTSDPLYALLKANRPVPDAGYQTRVADTLRSLPVPRTRPFAVRRPLLFAAILLLLLASSVGAGFALQALFRNVFFGSAAKLEERIDEQHAQLEQMHEGLEALPEESAGEAEEWIDFQEQSSRHTHRILSELAEYATVIGQAQDGMILSEFAVYDTPGMESIAARHLCFGISAPADAALPETVLLTLDGLAFSAYLFDRETADSEQFAVYDCIPMLEPQALPKASLLVLAVNDDRFCFRCTWETQTVTLPQSDAERIAWLAQSAALSDAAAHASCVCLTAPIVRDGLTVSITDLSLDGNRLIIDADILAAPELSGKHADVWDHQLRIRSRTFSIGVSLFVTRLMHDDFDFSVSLANHAKWAIDLPYAPGTLSGEVITFSFHILTQDLENRSPQETPDKTSFSFELRMN